jgi:hypothetical protein
LYHGDLGPGLNGYWVEAKDLREGDVLLGVNGELSTVVSNERVEFPDGITVYNFTVDGNHDYFVIAQTDEFGQTCVLVHNGLIIEGSYRIIYWFHVDVREALNRFHEFESAMGDIEAALTDDVINKWKNGEMQTVYFLGETWTLYPPSMSIYHSEDGTGTDCFKFVSESGRELVLRIDKSGKCEIQKNPTYWGTYNYVNAETNALGHIALDMLPYWIWGNNSDDSNPWYKRIHPQSDVIPKKIIEATENASKNVAKYAAPKISEALDSVQEVATKMAANVVKSFLRWGMNKAMDNIPNIFLPH